MKNTTFESLRFGGNWSFLKHWGRFVKAYKYKFNGKELDEETGLYYYGARYYDPRTSIWLSVDPLAEMFPNWNPYHYVHQNPIKLIDPTGMAAEEGEPEKQKPGTGTSTGNLQYRGKDGLPNGVDAPAKQLDELVIQAKDKWEGTYWDQSIRANGGSGIYGPSTDERYAYAMLGVVAAPIVIGALAEAGAATALADLTATYGPRMLNSLWDKPLSYSSYFGKAGFDFTTEMAANKGNISKVNWISVGAAGLGADALSSPFSFTAKDGFQTNSFEQTIVNYGVNKLNGGITGGVKHLNTKPIFKNGFSQVYNNAFSIGTQSFLKNQTSDLYK